MWNARRSWMRTKEALAPNRRIPFVIRRQLVVKHSRKAAAVVVTKDARGAIHRRGWGRTDHNAFARSVRGQAWYPWVRLVDWFERCRSIAFSGATIAAGVGGAANWHRAWRCKICHEKKCWLGGWRWCEFSHEASSLSEGGGKFISKCRVLSLFLLLLSEAHCDCLRWRQKGRDEQSGTQNRQHLASGTVLLLLNGSCLSSNQVRSEHARSVWRQGISQRKSNLFSQSPRYTGRTLSTKWRFHVNNIFLVSLLHLSRL